MGLQLTETQHLWKGRKKFRLAVEVELEEVELEEVERLAHQSHVFFAIRYDFVDVEPLQHLLGHFVVLKNTHADECTK